jgi:hypothetical protein
MSGKYLSDTFSTQNDMKQGQALEIPFQLALEYIRNVHEKQEDLKLTGTPASLLCPQY